MATLSRLSIPTELIDKIVAEVITYGRRKDVTTCALLCKQWHEVTLRQTFRCVTFLLYKEDGLIAFRQLIERNTWLAPSIRSATLKFKRWSEGMKQNPGEFLMPVLDALSTLAPQLQTLIFDDAHCRQGWVCRVLSRHLQPLRSVSTLKFRICTLRMSDIKMFLRAMPNMQHLDLSSSILSGDSKVGLSPADVPALKSLRLSLSRVSRKEASRKLLPAVVKLLTTSVAVRGISCLSLDTPVSGRAEEGWSGVVGDLIRTLGPSLKYLRWYGDSWTDLETEFGVSTIDLTANVHLHTLVLPSPTRTARNVADSQLSRVLNTIIPGALRRIMLCHSFVLETEFLHSYASLLSRPRFQSLTDIYFVQEDEWLALIENRSIGQDEQNVQTAFAEFIARGVVVRVLEHDDGRVVADRWEKETIVESD
ncbi:hypothetical protein EIP91_003303 [Steccherinum ochraceum]|uniref:F-box domain-containing protein n=1 Tax=Steccherinum ochraceum TaxID=92696 RepID=A0A4R0RH53_9APHY|nr:hypothetical protein EIP91_003303 [Steccherinum ochraceum]